MPQSATPNQDKVITGLEKALANTYTLMIKTHNFHWNVQGENFVGLHNLFEKQYNDLFKAVDELAERIRALGAPAPGGLEAFKGLTSIKDAPTEVQNSRIMVQTLIDSRQAMLKDDEELLKAAEDSDDQVTQDMITSRIAQNQKDIWMLRSVIAT
jgi:starvation-inducible DNA-binding protein